MRSRLPAAIGTLFCIGPVSANGVPTTLVAGMIAEHPLGAGEKQEYVVSLQANDYLAVDIEEHGVDVTLRVFDPEGNVLTEQQTPYSRTDSDRVRLIAARSGQFRLEVMAESPPAATYLINTLAIRPPTSRDRIEIAASAAFHAALRAAEDKTPQDLRMAIREFGKAIEYGEASHDSNLVGDAALLAGRLSFRLDERRQAIDYTTKALTAFKTSGNHRREARALNNLGAIYQEMAEPTKAIGYLTQALSILQVTRDETTEAIVLHNLGWYHQLLGEYSTSGNYYRRALRVEDDAFRANTLNNLGRLNASLGDFEAAQEYMQRASSECERHGDGRCKAETLVNLGSLLLQQRQADAARDRFNAAVTTIEGMQNDVWRAKALLGLASVAPNPSAPEVGARIQTAIALVRRLKDRRIEADGLQALGNWYKARNVVSLAKTTYEEALALQQATGEMEGQAQVLLAIAGLLRDSGDLEHALAHVERAIETRESLREQVARPDLRSTYLATTQEYYDLYVDILMALHARTPLAGYDRKALQASERARARGLIEALAERGSDILGRSNPDLVERERALRRKLNARDQRLRTLAGEEGNFERKVKAEQELSATIGDLRELQGEIRSHDPRYAELTHPPELDVKALQQQIDDDSVLLEYWLGTKRSFVWVVTNHSVSSHALPPGEAIESAARRYIATLTARPSNRQPGTATAVAEDEAGRVLGLALLAPLAKELQHRRLIVVRYGALEYIPFAALPLPSAAGTNPTRLIQTHEIVNLPAATVLGSLRKARTRAPQKTIAIFADPVFSRDDPRVRDALQPTAHLNRITRDDPTALQRSAAESGLQSLRRLRYSRLEADAIAALVPAGERLEALDFQSNRTTALGNDIAQFRFLHFATHGLLDSVHPELSGLVFSTVDERGRPRDGLVRLHEIFGLSLQADLVVLSACQTALGRDIKGEGLVGLTRGFMYAGAPRVIATLWDVDDRATAELMRRFYQHLLKERPTAAVSLRAAQLSLMQDPQWSSPYYWAGFILLGDWN